MRTMAGRSRITDRDHDPPSPPPPRLCRSRALRPRLGAGLRCDVGAALHSKVSAMNPSDKLDRLAADVAREIKRYSPDDTRRGRRIAEFSYRVASLLILDD